MKHWSTCLSENEYEHPLLCFRLRGDRELTLESVKQNYAEVFSQTGNNRVLVLLDLCQLQFAHVPREIMQYAADNEYQKFQIAYAILYKDLAMKLITNFYLRIFRPPVPSRGFTSEAEAVEWLRSFVPEKS